MATGTPREIFRQVDMMESIGLGVPEAAKLCAMLRAKGLQLPDNVYTLEEIKEDILKLWKEGHQC